MQTLVECVPNFSEGRDGVKVDAIIEALLRGPEVYLLDKEMDADHNRSVVTIVGTRETVGEAALRGIGRAAELIDLNRHQGAHPRLGATDVVPFVPVAGVTLEDCVRIAERVGEEAWRRFRIPIYLYEAAARKPERRNLENIRRGQFEGLREEIRSNPERRPDFGDSSLHPTAGATVVGARKFLIAYNINLNSADVALAKSIAKKIRASSGGMPHVKAMGVDLKARNLAQVSMNLTDFETTPLSAVFEAVSREAAAQGVTIAGSDIVGLIPRCALEQAAVHHLKVDNFHPDLIFENRLARVIEQRATATASRGAGHSTAPPQPPGGAPLRSLAEEFVSALASESPTPGGGSASALAAALGAALAEMVCRLTLRRASYAAHRDALEATLAHLGGLRARLLENVDRDARSYEAVLAALRLPRTTDSESLARSRAVEEASKSAALVPLETANLAVETGRAAETLRGITIPQAASDLAVAAHLAKAAELGAVENVRANLPSIRDGAWLSEIETKLRGIGA